MPTDPLGNLQLPVGRLRMLGTMSPPDRSSPRDRGNLGPFAGPSRERKLRVVWDNGASPGQHAIPPGLAATVLSDPSIEVWHYADEGPPPELLETQESGHFRMTGAPGWLTFHHQSGDIGEAGTVTRLTDSGATVSGIWPDPWATAQGAVEWQHTREQRRSDSLCFLVAQASGADLLITDRASLRSDRIAWLTGTHPVLTPDVAIGFMCLYLRELAIFPDVITSGIRLNVRPSEAFMLVARVLAPRVGRLGAGPDIRRWIETPDGLRALRSLARAARERDQVHASLLAPNDYDITETALVSFEHCLTHLLSAFDVVARNAHHYAGLPPQQERAAKFQNQPWLEQVSRHVPDLLDVFHRGAVGRSVFDVVRILRNYIHEGGFTHISVRHPAPRRRIQSLVAIPTFSSADEDAFDAALRCLSPFGDWSFARDSEGGRYGDMGILVEHLVPAVGAVLDEIADRLTDGANGPITETQHLGQGDNFRAALLGHPNDEIEASIRAQYAL